MFLLKILCRRFKWRTAAIGPCAQRQTGYGLKYCWVISQFEPKSDQCWTYAPSEPMPQSDCILKCIIDMRPPLTFSLKDCALVVEIISQEVARGY